MPREGDVTILILFTFLYNPRINGLLLTRSGNRPQQAAKHGRIEKSIDIPQAEIAVVLKTL
ncbi:MAG: hypothetical protein SWY16_22195 [Cyanobacteriota bacterium]|nr:hypothetical protein [Cyanobacteriota bacterium]